MKSEGSRPIIVGVTGASGIIYAVRLLEALRSLKIETHLVVTKPAEMAAAHEWSEPMTSIRTRADINYKIGDVGAASGSFRTTGDCGALLGTDRRGNCQWHYTKSADSRG